MALKSVVLNPGDCIVLPATTVITSVIVNGAGSATSTCGPLPSPGVYKCGKFAIIVDNDDNEGHPMNEKDTYYTSITVGSNTYIINELVVQGENPGIATAVGTLNLHITDIGLLEFKAVTQTDLTKRSLVWLFFKVPEALYGETELKLTSFGTDYYLKPYEADCDEYPIPE